MAIVTAKNTRATKRMATPQKMLNCIHLGNRTKEMVKCMQCKGTHLKVFECAKHGKCTVYKTGQTIQHKCSNCPDYCSKD